MKPKLTKFNTFFYVILLLSLTISTSCNKDKEEEPEFTLIGTWNIDNVAVWWENNSTGELIEGPDSDVNLGTVVFNENNTGVWTDKIEDVIISITWSILDNKLTIGMGGYGSIPWTIDEKDVKNLKLTYQKLDMNVLEKRELELSKLN